MFIIKSRIKTGSSDFIKKKKEYLEVLNEFRKRLSENTQSGTEKAVQKHRKRGKLLVRERVNLLIDDFTPFLELSALAAYNLHDNQFPSAGIVTGIGVIHGRECMIVANDATVKGGTYVRETIKKHVRAQEIAQQNNLPCIYMVDSGGVFLPQQSEVFADKEHFGRFFYNQARMSAEGIPQISIVMGSCTAGGAYVPAMSDETIIVRNQGTIFIGGPPLVKAATGEEVTAEELGGAEVHTSISGVSDHIAENDEHAIQICRNIVKSFPVTERSRSTERQKLIQEKTEDPLYKSDELYGIAPLNLRKPFEIKEIIARIVDGSKFHEFKEKYAPTIITGFARIYGYSVGIIANNGVIFSETALKAAHFIQLCTQRKIPIIFLQNITGFIVGKEYEHKGIARDGAKLIHAVANANVPKFTVVVGGSFGAGNYAMAGRAYEPRLLFMWPNAKISVMGGEQAAGVLITVKEQQLKAKGQTLSEEERKKLENEILRKYEEEGSAYYSTSRLWDDGIIDPADTRKILAMSISMSLNKPFGESRSGVYRM